ncbi:MAG: hypothetical protein NT013_14125 [Planctomycetia bacterium]|nr:hypothetical protein [Planctomycetia bacterium]
MSAESPAVLAQSFKPPAKYAGDLSGYRSLLKFGDESPNVVTHRRIERSRLDCDTQCG